MYNIATSRVLFHWVNCVRSFCLIRPAVSCCTFYAPLRRVFWLIIMKILMTTRSMSRGTIPPVYNRSLSVTLLTILRRWCYNSADSGFAFCLASFTAKCSICYADTVSVRRGSRRGHPPRAALCRGRHLKGQKYGILKFGRFWRIGVCIGSCN